jgi:hypothetical protein
LTAHRHDPNDVQAEVRGLRAQTAPCATTRGATSNVLPFGNERTDHILPWMLLDALRDPKAGMTDLLQLIHYNSSVPENHNITIPNMNKPIALVMGLDGKWIKQNKAEVIDQMLNKSHFLMETFLRTGEVGLLDEDELNDAIQFLNNLNPKRDPKGWGAQRSETELLILNNRSKVVAKRSAMA